MTPNDCVATAAILADWKPPQGILKFQIGIIPSDGRVLVTLETCCIKHTSIVIGPGTKSVTFSRLDEFAAFVLSRRDERHKDHAVRKESDGYHSTLTDAGHKFMEGINKAMRRKSGARRKS
jgi:hypothetical protein